MLLNVNSLQEPYGQVYGGNRSVPEIAISLDGQFRGNIGQTQNTYFPWVKSYFPVDKRASGTATIVHYDRTEITRSIATVLTPHN